MPFMKVVDKDNGEGYSVNLPRTGCFITVPNSNTKMMYEVKTIDGSKIVFIRYIHYDTKKQLLSLLAFAVQWWSSLKPSMIYMREKKRRNGVGDILVKLGFSKNRVKNQLKQFDCNIDGTPCQCPVYEYFVYGQLGKEHHKNNNKIIV